MTHMLSKPRTSDAAIPVSRTRSWAVPATWLILLAGLLIVWPGCSRNEETPVAPTEQTITTLNPLTMLVVGDDQLGGRIARQWSARRDGKLNINSVALDEFVSGGFEIDGAVDIIVYPPGLIGDLNSRDRLIALPKDVWNSDGINKIELLRHFRVTIARRGNETWAVPLGGPNFAMLCNRQLFESVSLGPPDTWDELDRDLEKIRLALESDSSTGSRASRLTAAVDMPLAKGWAAQTFLARVAPAVCHRGKLSTVFDRRTMEPLIASPPFIEALEHLKAIATPRSLELNPAGVFDLANSGQSAIALGWPARGFENQAGGSDLSADESNQDPITIHPIPGMDRWYDQQNNIWIKRSDTDDIRVDLIGFSGLAASVSAGSRNETTAMDFIQWLPSKSISLLTLVESPGVGPFRASHLGDASRWTGDAISVDVADQYADVIAANHERSLVMLFPRIPGQSVYLEILDNAVRDFLTGSKTAEETLDSVAKKWDATTEKIGRKEQIKEFKRETGV